MKNLVLIFLSLIIFFACNQTEKELPFQALEYDVYMGDNLAGYHKSYKDEAGYFSFVFEFNDRGRGPYLEEKIHLNSEGLMDELKIKGHNYLKDSVNEKFTFDEKVAEWKSKSEKGTVSSDGKAFYIPVNGTFGSSELLMRKLLDAKDKTISLLPSGTAKIADVKNVQINDNLNLNLVEVTGLDFTPTYVWMDDEKRFFASVSSWLSCIRSGYDTLRTQLLDIQTDKRKDYYNKLAKQLTERPTGPVVIKNVNIFDVKSSAILDNKTVVVRENKIANIFSEDESIPNATLTIDGTGKTLLPGLFDMHGHLDRTDGILNLAGGVTSTRDLANSLELLEIKEEFDNNLSIGPRVLVMSGFIDQAGPYAGPLGKIVSSLEEGLEAIDFYKERGYQQIKLYSSIDPDWVKPLAERAHEQNLRLSGHIPAFMRAEQAVVNGYDEIQHVNMLVLNFLSDTIDTRTPLRFSMVAEHARNIDLKSHEFKGFIKLLKENNIVVDPTVSIFEGLMASLPGEPSPMLKEILNRLPVQVKRGYFSGGLPIPEGKLGQYKESYEKLLEIVNELHINGITIVPGTDAMAGFSLHKELENYVKAGIPNAEVLKIATLVSAEVIGVQDQLGSIEEGKLADLILVDGNPLENISDIRRVELTMKDGKIYKPAELYEAIGVKHFE
ncbi:amidohydrolase family protein [Xanthovirga aplysinae]|uniref:amidohydrolase family protein n=1 Tax=Xanthovirga aplysinae TaxID=2529853 RepID=UPI0012BD1296|nr:amidohydrolase family protein [Xanthovirga aplysinae]MTI31200.1 amidohydrolase [Xanthovirga aplysinae]